MAPYVEREWGAEGDRDDVAGQAAGRSRRRSSRPGVLLNRDPRAHLRNLKSAPQIEDVGQPVHRVRLLRAGLPEPRPHDDAAPADRPAARDGPPAARARRCSRRCSSSTTTTPSRPARPTGPAAWPARLGSTPGELVKELRGAPSTARAPRRVAPRWRRRWGTRRTLSPRRPARGGRTVGDGLLPALSGARPQACWARSWSRPGAERDARPGAADCPGAPARGPPPSTSRPASTASSATPAIAPARPSLAEAMLSRLRPGRAAAVDPTRRRRASAARPRGARRATARAGA